MMIKDLVTNEKMTLEQFAQYMNEGMGHDINHIKDGEVFFNGLYPPESLEHYIEELNSDFGYELELY